MILGAHDQPSISQIRSALTIEECASSLTATRQRRPTAADPAFRLATSRATTRADRFPAEPPETKQPPAAGGPDDPYGLGLVVRSTPLRTEAEGKQDYDWGTQRGWKVMNDNVPNGLGTPVGYKLVPSAAFPPLLDPASPAFKRAEVIGHTLWVTPYREDERWPCGDFPNLSEHDTGLPVWTAANRSIENADVVLWYVFGIHHITRPEDWPVMPSDIVPFWLKPFGFFDRNPRGAARTSGHPDALRF